MVMEDVVRGLMTKYFFFLTDNLNESMLYETFFVRCITLKEFYYPTKTTLLEHNVASPVDTKHRRRNLPEPKLDNNKKQLHRKKKKRRYNLNRYSTQNITNCLLLHRGVWRVPRKIRYRSSLFIFPPAPLVVVNLFFFLHSLTVPSLEDCGHRRFRESSGVADGGAVRKKVTVYH